MNLNGTGMSAIVRQCNSLGTVHMDDCCVFLVSSPLTILVTGLGPVWSVQDLLFSNHTTLWVPKGKSVLVLDNRKLEQEECTSPRVGYLFFFLRKTTWSSELNKYLKMKT